MKGVRLTHACGLNERVFGDTGTPLVLDDAEAAHLVEVLHLAVYAPEYDPQPEAQEISVTFVGPQRAAERFQELKAKAETEQDTATQRLVELTEKLGLYDEPAVPVTEPDAELKMPWTTHPKADWINWAVNGDHGQQPSTPEDAALLSKRELMGRYGERL